MKTILFVCTGNTCRSPMAEVLCNKMLSEAGVTDIKALSAGLAVAEGVPASQNAICAVGELSTDLSAHVSRQVTREMIADCDAVYAMTGSHAAMLKKAFPEFAEKISVLGDGIPDPYGGDIEVYRSCRDNILEALKKLKNR